MPIAVGTSLLIIVANSAQLAGHVRLEDCVVVGGVSGLHGQEAEHEDGQCRVLVHDQGVLEGEVRALLDAGVGYHEAFADPCHGLLLSRQPAPQKSFHLEQP